MGLTLADLIRYAKKAIKFWKAFQKKQQQQGQQHRPTSTGPAQHPQQTQNQNPYPPLPAGQHPHQGAWQASPYPPPQPAAHNQQGTWQASSPYPPASHHPQAHAPTASPYPAVNEDMAHAQNAHYVDLRNSAIREGDLMGNAFSASKAAYASGDGARAKQLSNEGHEHQRLRDEYNHQAAEWIYAQNNSARSVAEVDLHGLYVQESVEFTEKAVQAARQANLSELRIIVGKGNHSASHVAKIKPAIEALMARERLSAALDPRNAGVLVVYLQGQPGGSREILGDIERSQDICLVM